ncbi:hypothetical protein ASA01S_001_00440 [Aeromonas salmonicida subsp. masoucida NBRC 13784]|nr:hypothetical protein ASA01S_001_00440 [Aeromonas salmonicida subsp. masoucida NBRC 13784]
MPFFREKKRAQYKHPSYALGLLSREQVPCECRDSGGGFLTSGRPSLDKRERMLAVITLCPA